MAKRTVEQIRKEISEWNTIIDDASVPVDERDEAKSMVEDLEKEIVNIDKKHVTKSDKKETKKQKSGTKKKKAGTKKPKSAPKPKPAPKPKKDADKKPDCDELESAWDRRRAAAKASNNKAKTRSIYEIVSDKIESAVEKVIKDTPVDEIDTAQIKDFKKLRDSMENFLQSFKAVLGDDYEAEETKAAVSGVTELIDKLEAKYAKK